MISKCISIFGYLLLSGMTLVSCNGIFDRLSQINEEPRLSGVTLYESRLSDDGLYKDSSVQIDPRHQNNDMYRSTTDGEKVPVSQNFNSIWHDRSNGFAQGCKSFFKARSVGDVISVAIILDNLATLNSQTSTNQRNASELDFGAAFGAQKNYGVDVRGESDSTGGGNINRKEAVRTTIGVTVVKVMPSSGNLLVRGSQEMRINNEIRVITLEGIIRPEDITEKNVVLIERVAEARISYGGKGQIAQYQYPPYGRQVLDAISPF